MFYYAFGNRYWLPKFHVKEHSSSDPKVSWRFPFWLPNGGNSRKTGLNPPYCSKVFGNSLYGVFEGNGCLSSTAGWPSPEPWSWNRRKTCRVCFRRNQALGIWTWRKNGLDKGIGYWPWIPGKGNRTQTGRDFAAFVSNLFFTSFQATRDLKSLGFSKIWHTSDTKRGEREGDYPCLFKH